MSQQDGVEALAALAAEVRRCRAVAGLSQDQLAVLIHYGHDRVSKAERGRNLPSAQVIDAIDHVLGAHGHLTALRERARQEQVLGRERITFPGAAPSDAGRAGGDVARRLLAHAAAVTVGAARHEPDGWSRPVPHEETPVPTRVGPEDVAQTQAVARDLRALDYQFGGGACRDAVAAQVLRTQRLLRADCADNIRVPLLLALADLHNVAGWTAFDIGLYDAAARDFTRALELAQHVGESSLVANVLYRMGRLHLHLGLHREALKFFQLGQIAAQDASCELTVAMLCVNEAWAYALLGDVSQVRKSVGRAADELARADPADASPWVRFFGVADLEACEGMAYAALAGMGAGFPTLAIESLQRSLERRGPEMSRSRAFELTALATVHLAHGDLDHGVEVGHQAADLAQSLRSTRVVDRLVPLQRQAEARAERSSSRDLAARVASLRGS